MKQKCTKSFHVLWCSLAILMALFVSCEKESTYGVTGNTGDLGTLSYEWADALVVNDTVYMTCNQNLVYTQSGNSQTIAQKAIIKIWCQKPLVEYAAGMNPKPRLTKMSPTDKTYAENNPRRRIVRQQCTLHDGQIAMIELSFDLYSYDYHNREQFFPHVELSEARFNNADAVAENGYYKATVLFDVPWSATDGSGQGTKTISVSYLKKRVEEVDKVLNTNYETGIEWLGANTFKLYLDKVEEWQIAGYQPSRTYSPELSFVVNKSGDKSIEAKDFNFGFTTQASATTKQKVDTPSPWNIKKADATQTLMFTNGSDYFEDKFTYPLYDATIVMDGQTFGFDLNVVFNAVNQLSITDGKNVTTATVKFGGRSFDASVITKITKKEEEIPVVETGKGKILYFSVTAVFDTAEADKDDGDITKKCVLVRYEKGYDWGICTYEDDFPRTFTYTESDYGAYNSAAKRTKDSPFELARATETTSAILWYDGNNDELSGISGLECLILGWKNQYNGKNSYRIESYGESLSADKYTLTLTAPNGATHVFDGHNK